jgi:hypothetical protein
LKQPSFDRICSPFYSEWVVVFLYKPLFSYVMSSFGNFLSCLVCSYVHKIVLLFYGYFAYFNPHVVSYFFCLASSPSCAILSQTDLLEVPVTYLGSLSYFSAWGLMLANGCPSERPMLIGGPVCATCLVRSRILSIHTSTP